MHFDYSLLCNKLLQTLLNNLQCGGWRRVKELAIQAWQPTFTCTYLHKKAGIVEHVFIAPVLGSEAETGGLLGLVSYKSNFSFSERPSIIGTKQRVVVQDTQHPSWPLHLCVQTHTPAWTHTQNTHTSLTSLIILLVIIVKVYSKHYNENAQWHIQRSQWFL